MVRPPAQTVSRLVWIVLTSAIAFCLRLFHLGVRSFWLDEAASSMLARADWHTFAGALAHRQANMALYYFLLRGWVHLGNGEWWIRLLSALAGVAAVPVVYLLANLILGQRPARIASLLLAAHSFHIAYSQEARGYSLVVFLALLGSYWFLKLDTGSRWTWIAYVFTSALMVYTQIFGTLVLLAQWACLLWRWKSEGTKRRMLAAAAITVLISPLGLSLLLISDHSQLQWMNQTSVSNSLQLLIELSGNAGGMLLILDVALVLGSALLYLRDRKTKPANPNMGYLLLLLWLLVPILIVTAISLNWSILQARYLIVCVPPLLLLVADGLARIQLRVVFASALMAVVALSLVAVNSYYRSRADLSHSDNWRDATRYILSESLPGDAVLFPYSAEEIAFREYRNQFTRDTVEITLVPQRSDLELLSTAGNWTSEESASSAASQHPRVWVISALQPNDHSRATRVAIQTQRKESVLHMKFGFVSTELFANGSVGAQESR